MAENQEPARHLVEHLAADGCLIAGVVGVFAGLYVLWGAGVTLLVGGALLVAAGLAFGAVLRRGSR